MRNLVLISFIIGLSFPSAAQSGASQAICSAVFSGDNTVMRRAFAHHLLYVLERGMLAGVAPLPVRTPPPHPLKDPHVYPELIAAVQRVSELHPDLLHPSEAAILWRDTDLVDVGVRLLKEMRKLNDRGFTSPKTALEVLSLALGFNLQDIEAAEINQLYVARFYDYALILSSNLEEPPFAGIAIDPKVWQPKTFYYFLNLLATLASYHYDRGATQGEWNHIVDELELRGGIRADMVGELAERASRAQNLLFAMSVRRKAGLPVDPR